MRHYPNYLLTAGVAALVGIATPARVSAADPGADNSARIENRAEETALALPPGFQEKDVHAVGEVKSGLATLTERFVTKGDFSKYLAELAKPDKDRTQQFKDFDQTKIDGRIDQIQKAWKTKYGKDFDLNDKKVVFDERFKIVQGEVSDPNLALANWPLAPLANEAVAAGGRQAPERDAKQAERDAKAEKLEKGRNVAAVRFPMGFNLPAINVCMIHQLPLSYHVDIPDNRTGEQVYNDLLNHLTWIGEHVDQWPSDINDGYRMFAYHAVAAAYGIDVPKGKAS